MIEASHIRKQFRRYGSDSKSAGKMVKERLTKQDFWALDDVSLSASDGEILGVLGPNGAGKTTLLRIMGRIMSPTEGDVVIKASDGSVINDETLIKKKIGYLSANTKLYHRFSIRELLRMFGDIYNMTEKETSDRIDGIIDVLSLSDFVDNRIDTLSTGQIQRANIARCLIHNPDIYIFDEPTLGLDIISSRSIIDFMKEEKKKGKTIIYSTHYMEEAQYLCDRIVLLHKGIIVDSGTPQDLMDKYKTNNLRDTFQAIIDCGEE